MQGSFQACDCLKVIVIFRDLKPWIRFSFSFLRLGKLFCDSNKHGSDTPQNWPLLDPGPLFLGNYSQVPGCPRLSKDVSIPGAHVQGQEKDFSVASSCLGQCPLNRPVPTHWPLSVRSAGPPVPSDWLSPSNGSNWWPAKEGVLHDAPNGTPFPANAVPRHNPYLVCSDTLAP